MTAAKLSLRHRRERGYRGLLLVVCCPLSSGYHATTLAALSPEVPRSALRALADSQADAYTGHPSGELMTWLGSDVAQRGGQPEAAETYVQRAYAPLRPIVDQRLAAARRCLARARGAANTRPAPRPGIAALVG